MSRAVAVVLGAWLALAGAPAAAGAAVRHAVAQGGATTGDCAVDACTLPHALDAAVNDDEVLVHPGEYSLAHFTINKRLYVHGVEDQPRPRLIDSSGITGQFVELDANDIRLRHLHIETARTNYALHSTDFVTLERLVVVAGPGVNTFGAMVLEISTPTIRDTVVRSAHPNGVALWLRGTINAQLRNLTAHAPGAGGMAVNVEAGDYSNGITPCDPSVAGTATARNVIARGGQHDLRVYSQCNKSATLNIRNSNFRPDHVSVEGGALATVDAGGAAGGNQSGDPLFADAASGDLHLLAGSPAIDAGVADAQNGTADIDGDPRPTGSAPDIGADEFVPPSPSSGSSTGTGGSGTPPAVVSGLRISPLAFPAARSGPSAKPARRRRTGAIVSFRLDRAASMRFTVERALGGRRVRGRCVKPKPSNRSKRRCTRYKRVRGGFTWTGAAGGNRFRFTGRLRGRRLRPARYRLITTPRAGDRSGKPKRARFRIKR